MSNNLHHPIIKNINAGKFEKIYFLHGEEPYYIDLIADAIEDKALEEHERDFNQSILYGKDTDVLSLISELKAYPMMAERRLVILREAQDLKDKDGLLEAYFENPTETTVFVFCHKHKKFDSRKKAIKQAAKNGIVYLSEKVRDYKINEWITEQVKEKGYSISSKAANLLGEFLGTDLSRINNELDKLAILLEAGTTISDVHIEENIGISKDYNMFELTAAIQKYDVPKAMSIVKYFEQNPKSGPLVAVIGNVFGFFSKLMKIHFLPNKNPQSVAQATGLPPFVAGELIAATKVYPPKKIAANIAILHEYDLKSKGIGNSSFSEGELMRELIYKMLH